MSTRRLAETVEGLNSSLAGALWPKKGRPIAVVKGLNLPIFIPSATQTKATQYF